MPFDHSFDIDFPFNPDTGDRGIFGETAPKERKFFCRVHGEIGLDTMGFTLPGTPERNYCLRCIMLLFDTHIGTVREV